MGKPALAAAIEAASDARVAAAEESDVAATAGGAAAEASDEAMGMES